MHRPWDRHFSIPVPAATEVNQGIGMNYAEFQKLLEETPNPEYRSRCGLLAPTGPKRILASQLFSESPAVYRSIIQITDDYYNAHDLTMPDTFDKFWVLVAKSIRTAPGRFKYTRSMLCRAAKDVYSTFRSNPDGIPASRAWGIRHTPVIFPTEDFRIFVDDTKAFRLWADLKNIGVVPIIINKMVVDELASGLYEVREVVLVDRWLSPRDTAKLRRRYGKNHGCVVANDRVIDVVLHVVLRKDENGNPLPGTQVEMQDLGAPAVVPDGPYPVMGPAIQPRRPDVPVDPPSLKRDLRSRLRFRKNIPDPDVADAARELHTLASTRTGVEPMAVNEIKKAGVEASFGSIYLNEHTPDAIETYLLTHHKLDFGISNSFYAPQIADGLMTVTGVSRPRDGGPHGLFRCVKYVDEMHYLVHLHTMDRLGERGPRAKTAIERLIALRMLCRGYDAADRFLKATETPKLWSGIKASLHLR